MEHKRPVSAVNEYPKCILLVRASTAAVAQKQTRALQAFARNNRFGVSQQLIMMDVSSRDPKVAEAIREVMARKGRFAEVTRLVVTDWRVLTRKGAAHAAWLQAELAKNGVKLVVLTAPSCPDEHSARKAVDQFKKWSKEDRLEWERNERNFPLDKPRLRELVYVRLLFEDKDGTEVLLTRVPGLGDEIEHDGLIYRINRVRHYPVNADGRADFGWHAFVWLELLPEQTPPSKPRRGMSGHSNRQDQSLD